MSLMSFAFSTVSKISVKKPRNQEKCFQSKVISTEKGTTINFFVLNFYNTIFFQLILSHFFRDNGITIQIMSYQVYTELILFLGFLIAGLLPSIIENMIVMKIVGIVTTFAIFVVQPLFYLNGDANFRNRVQNQGLWKALKKELFQTNSLFQPV